uniref:Uncharacterized protein n=1 Tax=Glossina palpalis gambiensis TaxID=67801 RepID=A0A1B0AZE4_9MUSC
MSSRKQEANDVQCLSDLKRIANEFNKSKHVDKDVVRKFFSGFRYLTICLELEERDIFECIINWCRLYARIPFYIDPLNEKLQRIYEDSIPMVFPHIIGYLPYSVRNIETYHYMLLETMDTLLRNASFTALQEIGNFRPGSINNCVLLFSSCFFCPFILTESAGLQYPIEKIGDFNTQLLALKLMTRLLKYADIEKQNQELKNVPWFNIKLIENDLSAVIKEANRGQFENVARGLLNKFNMNLTMLPHKVYSLYCDYLCFQKNFDFYKPLNCDKFWINFNYSPRTLSFIGHYKKLMKSGFDTVHVTVKITALNLERKTLIVHYNEPVRLSEYSNVLEELNGYKNICLFLSDEEVNRLKCNRDFFDHFNEHEYDNDHNSVNSHCSSVSQESSSRHGDFSNKFRKSLNLLIGEANDNNSLIPVPTMQSVKARSEPRIQQPMDIIDAIETPKTSKLSNTNVTKSHSIQRLHSNSKNSASIKNATTMRKKSTEAANSSTLASRSKSFVQPVELVNLNRSERTRKVSTYSDISNYEPINSTEFIELMSNELFKTNKDNNIAEAANWKDRGAVNKSSNSGVNESSAKDNDIHNSIEMELNLTYDIDNQGTKSDPLHSSSPCVLRNDIIQTSNQLSDPINISLIREPKSIKSDTLSLRSNTNGELAVESINLWNDEIDLQPISDLRSLTYGNNRNEEKGNNSAQVVYASGTGCLGQKEVNNTLKTYGNKISKPLYASHLLTDEDYIIEKVNQITKKLLSEAGTQRVEIKEVKSRVQYLVRNLEGELKTYTNRFERFKRFEANIKQLLNDLYKRDSSTSANKSIE